ncbi:hypothetical protein C1E24_10520 [Pseudoalteromonas phenolica]|uniref:Uncharacterized protein n=1 Tax=Pseudoalteromonas phenolica TaxID=161398 RepID=A0A5R9Q2S5_9GAMM|nr:hypothetical protein [Pseudoalteromonas phenolica]TLX47225.1 hypothetical protein C1E24_10520 [Pseudoalteromonas phenolica]
MQQREVGQSLAQKSPIGMVFTLLLFIPLAVNSELILGNLISAIALGMVTVILLLSYWHGKGGSFFIFALLMPLILVVIAELPSFVALAWLINAFFFGASSCLFAYLLWSKSKK